MKILPEFSSDIKQKTVGRGHRYVVPGVSCNACAKCRKGQTCIGLPGVTTISGVYKDGDLYGAGFRAATDLMFGPWKDRVAKNEVVEGGWISNAPMRPSERELSQSGMQNPEAYFRKKFEAIPTPAEEARDRGKGVHLTLEQWLIAVKEGETPFLEPEYLEQARPIVDWLDQHECEILDVEVNIYHPTLLYGGQIDCVARRGNSLLVLDWKSGNSGIWNNAAAQVAAYVMAYEALTGETVNEGWVLRSALNGFEAKRVGNLDVAKELFINLHASRESWGAIEWEEGT